MKGAPGERVTPQFDAHGHLQNLWNQQSIFAHRTVAHWILDPIVYVILPLLKIA